WTSIMPGRTVSCPSSYVAFAGLPVSIDVILDPVTTIVALRSVLPVPSSTVAAWMRTGCAVCEEIVAVATRTATANAAADLMAANYNPLTRNMLKALAAVLVVFAAVGLAPADGALQEWPVYGGDPGGSKFSPLTDVDTSNVAGLAVAWEWATGEKALQQFGTRPGVFEVTPI